MTTDEHPRPPEHTVADGTQDATKSAHDSTEERIRHLFRHSQRAGIVHPLWQPVRDFFEQQDKP